MEKLNFTTGQRISKLWKSVKWFLNDFKRQFIRTNKASLGELKLFWKYITTPGKKSPLKDFWTFLNTPYPDSLFQDEEPQGNS